MIELRTLEETFSHESLDKHRVVKPRKRYGKKIGLADKAHKLQNETHLGFAFPSFMLVYTLRRCTTAVLYTFSALHTRHLEKLGGQASAAAAF